MAKNPPKTPPKNKKIPLRTGKTPEKPPKTPIFGVIFQPKMQRETTLKGGKNKKKKGFLAPRSGF
jgi:hypothetical protein